MMGKIIDLPGHRTDILKMSNGRPADIFRTSEGRPEGKGSRGGSRMKGKIVDLSEYRGRIYGRQNDMLLLSACGAGLRLIAWAIAYAPDGILYDMTEDDIEELAGWTEAPGKLVSLLLSMKVLSRVRDGYRLAGIGDE